LGLPLASQQGWLISIATVAHLDFPPVFNDSGNPNEARDFGAKKGGITRDSTIVNKRLRGCSLAIFLKERLASFEFGASSCCQSYQNRVEGRVFRSSALGKLSTGKSETRRRSWQTVDFFSWLQRNKLHNSVLKLGTFWPKKI